jgi:hypothetical protein
MLDRPYPLRRAESLERDVRTDTGLAATGMVLLGMLGGLGMILFLCGGGLQNVRNKDTAQGVGGIVIIVAVGLLCLVVGGMVWASFGRQSGTRIATIIIGSFAIAVLVLATGFAGLVYLFAGCFEPCGSQKKRAAWLLCPAPSLARHESGLGSAGPDRL